MYMHRYGTDSSQSRSTCILPFRRVVGVSEAYSLDWFSNPPHVILCGHHHHLCRYSLPLIPVTLFQFLFLRLPIPTQGIVCMYLCTLYVQTQAHDHEPCLPTDHRLGFFTPQGNGWVAGCNVVKKVMFWDKNENKEEWGKGWGWGLGGKASEWDEEWVRKFLEWVI
jgi:hypothetical protein